MFRLTLSPQPRWLELSFGVKVEVRPLTAAIYQAASAEAAKRIAALKTEAEEAAKAGQPFDPLDFNGANPSAMSGLFAQYQVEALLRYGAIRWEGVVDEQDNALPITTASIEAFAAQAEVSASFKAKYDATLATVSAEGNGSETSSDGASEEAASTADPAPADPAEPEPKAEKPKPAGRARRS